MSFADTYLHRAQNSILQIYDLITGKAETVAEFTHVVEAPFFSKDGKSLYYNCEGLIYNLNLATKAITKIDTGACIYCNNDHVLSPDGTEIAISGTTDPEGMSNIFRTTIGQGNLIPVQMKPLSYLHGWSPDGKTLSYCAGRMIGENMEWDIYTCPVDGGEETRLTDAPGLNDGPEYSKDGNTIWFNSVRTGLMQAWKMNADGTGQTQMTFDEDRNSWFPHISPDNTKAVYLAYRKGDLEPGAHIPDLDVELRMIPAEGGKPVTLLSFFGGQGTINVNSWHPDSTRFAFVSYRK